MKTVLSLSGGLDSSTLLLQQIKSKHSVYAVNFYYGSKHGLREGLAAEKICAHYSVPLLKLNVTEIFHLQNLSSHLMKDGGRIPEGHYNDESMKLTVVPGRNTIFTSILAGIAESIGFDSVALAIHAGDHHIYPDCRPKWFENMQGTIISSTEGRVILEAPFLHINKSEIVAYGLQHDLPYELTYTCYNGEAKHCQLCGSCRERREAFELNKAIDPLQKE